MRMGFAIRVALMMLATLLAVNASAQQGLRTVPQTLIGNRQAPAEEETDAGKTEEADLPPEELPATMIGLEAYRSVVQSGQYLVGPGDEFLVHPDNVDEPVTVRVLAEGGVFLPGVGRIHVAGRSLSEAHSAIEEAFRQSVRVGKVRVELSRPRKFPVPVVGLVEDPGIVVANALERVSEVIRRAQGLTEGASTRNIRLFRTADLEPGQAADILARVRQGNYDFFNEAAAHRVDLEVYYLKGDARLNPFVMDGDIIVVPPWRSTVRGIGALQRSAVFEFVPGERVSDLLELCMGFAPHYDDEKVTLFRFDGEGTRQYSEAVDVEGVLAGRPEADVELRPGDWLVVRSRPEFELATTLLITGEVERPGVYVVAKDGEPLRQVVERAGGLTPRAALAKARVVRPVPPEDADDPELDRILSIPSADRTEEEKQYFNMKSRERRGQMVVDFTALYDGQDESYNILLMPGDALDIPARHNTVTVSGQAAFPGVLTYEEGAPVSEYITRAGGLGWRASRDIRVIKARTGEMRRASDVVHVEPGDRIWIKEKPQRDYWSIFARTMDVVGQVSTIVLLYVTIVK